MLRMMKTSETKAAAPTRTLPEADRALLTHLVGSEFTAATEPDDRYLALLGWAVRHNACDFAEFVCSQESAHRFVLFSATEVNERRALNHARQISGSPFWAVMRVDRDTKAGFARRLLEFIGCRDETVKLALAALNFAPLPPRGVPGRIN